MRSFPFLTLASVVSLCGCATPLKTATRKGDLSRVKALLEQGADINEISAANNDRCQTPLGCAISGGHVDVVRLLLDKGVDPNKRISVNYWRDPPLTLAAGSSNREIVDLLLDYGADLDLALAYCEDPDPRLGDVREWRTDYRRECALTLRSVKEKRLAAGGPEPGVLRARKAAREAAEAELKARLPEIERAEKAGDEAQAAGDSRSALERYHEAVRLAPTGSGKAQALRGKALAAARGLASLPPVSQEARDRMERAQAFLRRAKSQEGYLRAVAELEQATALAPWWAEAYFNLGLVSEKAGETEGAIANMKLYLLAAPDASDANEVKKKIIDLEVAKEMEAAR